MYESSLEPARHRPAPLRPTIVVGALCLLSLPVVALVHQMATLAAAGLLQAIGRWGLFGHVAAMVSFDPVYASVIDRTLGNIEIQGVAIVSPLGSILHGVASGLFAGPGQVAGGALVAPIVSDGASLLALNLAEAGGEVFFIALGLALLVGGLLGSSARGPTSLTLRLLGIILQAKGIIGLLSLRFTPQDLEIMGVAPVFTKLFPLDAGTYEWLAEGPLLRLIALGLPMSFVLAVYGPLLTIGLIRYRPWRSVSLLRRTATSTLRRYVGIFEKRVSHPAFLAVGIIAGALLLPRFSPTLNNNSHAIEVEACAALPAEAPAPAQEATPTFSNGVSQEVPPSGPSKVVINGVGYNYSYAVNGSPERIQGVGYNVIHSQLSFEERVDRYNRDFAQMRQVGINTILGWNQKEFDELTLDKAHENGLGVVMPYHLPSNGEYGNPQYEQKLETNVREWVQRFKDHPALRMWGIGNEVIHGMGEKLDSPRIKAFAEFYLRLADAVHAIDPDHPVIYRGAEDVYLGPIKKALQNDGRHRPWLVYGANFFTFRMEKALREWAQKGPDVPLVVSEFAPCGLGQGDRAAGYRRMWRAISQHATFVLGGFAYVWSTDGPEALDRTMGLVNDNNWTMDGSLWSLRQAFRYDNAVLFDDFPPPD